MKRILPLLLALLMGASAWAQADKIVGTYVVGSPFNTDTAHVRITLQKNGTYQGRITWVNRNTNADGTPRTDEKNPDPKLRQRKPEEIVMCWGLKYQDGEWVDGVLYDPYSGKKFSVKYKLSKNGRDLEARYYKGVPAIGISATWRRIR